MQRIRQEMSDFIHRGLDSHVRLAVTGLSRAGKTALLPLSSINCCIRPAIIISLC